MSQPFYSKKYGDIYFNPENPEAEKLSVFIDANRIGERIRNAADFTVAELGFGFGLNCALTLWTARQRNALDRLRYVSVDEEPPKPAAARVLREKLTLCRAEFDTAWDNREKFCRISGAMEFLASVQSPVDAWYFDGFSPAKNPEMWTAEIFARAWAATKAGGTFSTYTSAGWVRRNLEAAGFIVEKIPGFAGKREMMRGYKTGKPVAG